MFPQVQPLSEKYRLTGRFPIKSEPGTELLTVDLGYALAYWKLYTNGRAAHEKTKENKSRSDRK